MSTEVSPPAGATAPVTVGPGAVGSVEVGPVVADVVAVRGVGPRVRHLRLALAAAAAVALLGAVVAGLTGGWDGASGLAAGVALVAGSYTASTLAIAWADSINPRMVFPIGMAMYVTKFSLFGSLLIFIGATEWPGKIPMAMGIVLGVVCWTATQIWWTVRTAHPFV